MASGSPAPRLDLDQTGADALTISDLYLRIEKALRGAFPGQVWVSGEVRSFNVSSRGHCYIDLVDPRRAHDTTAPVLKVVCWSSRWSRVRSLLDQLGIDLDAGLVVRVRGEVQLYKARGDISLILSELDTDALLGKVAAARARLVKALVDEGLFDRNRQLAVPRPPMRIGLVASPGTEGYRDFMGCLESSGLAFDVRVVPTHVQGRRAAASVATALHRFDAEPPDLLVVVRGGGSKADLATFDSEPVARAIAAAERPVWTGIGHTGDLSVADEVANRSFITPTECGQELVRHATEFWRSAIDAGLLASRLAQQSLADAERTLDHRRRSAATCARSHVDRHAERLVHRTGILRSAVRGHLDGHSRRVRSRAADLARSSVRSVASAHEELAVRGQRLALLSTRRLEVEGLHLDTRRRLLDAYDYRRLLERGYSVTRDANGTVVRSIEDVGTGDLLVTRLSDGELVSTVTGKEANHSSDNLVDAGRGTDVSGSEHTKEDRSLSTRRGGSS